MVMTALLVVANVMGAGMILPQLRRLRRTRTLAGVSGAWAGVGIAMNTGWVAYATHEHLWGLLPVSAVSLVLYLGVATTILSLEGPLRLRPLLAGGFIFALPPVLFIPIGGATAAGLALGTLYGIQFAPAVRTAWTSTDVSGISTVTWVMALTEAVIWLLYGTVEGDWALIVGGTGGATMAALILLRVWWLANRGETSRAVSA